MTTSVKERPGPVIFGKTIKEHTPWGSIYVTLNFDADGPFEVFITVGKSGSELTAMMEALSRIISIGLRSGCRLEDFIDTLKGLSGKEVWMFDYDEQKVVRSLPDAAALLLEKLLGRQMTENAAGAAHTTALGPAVVPEADQPEHDKGSVPCPECGAPMEPVSGCLYCYSCGYSPCK